MAKEYNLTELLDSKKSTIRVGESVYEVTNIFKDILRLDGLQEKKATMGTEKFMLEFLSIALGSGAAKKILDSGYSTKLILAIISSIEDAIKEESIVDDGQGA